MGEKLQLYERVPKTIDYPRGEAEIDEGEFLISGPVILGVAAQDDTKSVFGVSKLCMNIAGLQIREYNPQGYNLEDFPASFCAIRLEKTDEIVDKDIMQQFYSDYLKDVIEENLHKKSVDEVAKLLRNFNILGYCNGNERINDIIQTLKSNMERLGYSKDDIDFSISQIGLITLATEFDTRKIGCTVVDFHEMKDTEVSPKFIHRKTETVLEENKWIEGFCIIDDRRAEYAVADSDEHRMQHYFKDGVATPACLRKVLSNLLTSSINASGGKFIPLTASQMMEGCSELIQYAKEGKSKKEILQIAEQSIHFNGARKLSEGESKLLYQIERAFDSFNTQRNEIATLRAYNKNLEKRVGILEESIDNMCTEQQALNIKIRAGLWQYKDQQQKDELENMLSDKEKIEKLQSMLNTVLNFADKVRDSRFGRFFFRKDIKKLPPTKDEFVGNNQSKQLNTNTNENER